MKPAQQGGGRRSLPARGAWIEIPKINGSSEIDVVAPRTGSMD